MSFGVLLHPKRVKRVITRLPHAHQKKLKELIDILADDPYFLNKSTQFVNISSQQRNFDIKMCKGHNNRFRVRFGDFRLVYEVDDDEKLVLHLKPDVRGGVYSAR